MVTPVLVINLRRILARAKMIIPTSGPNASENAPWFATIDSSSRASKTTKFTHRVLLFQNGLLEESMYHLAEVVDLIVGYILVASNVETTVVDVECYGKIRWIDEIITWLCHQRK